MAERENQTENTGNIEKIGQIILDYEYYPGEDLYCDGEIEDELLEIVRNHPESDFPAIIEARASWPILYHLSPLRENIVSWMPLHKDMKVLEVGSGCGAITGALAEKAGSVTCIDLSKKRSHINAYRHKDCDNVTIHVGNFKDIEPGLPCDFDYIFLIGVFEYALGYMGTQTPYEDFMAILKKHLKKTATDEGRLVIAIENKFGLKYWAGCREDHTGELFDGIEDYPAGGGVRTFTRKGLEKICVANGMTDYTFYYPYPDYKFMTTLYSDNRLPMAGELSNNLRNFDRPRLLLFDEKNVFDTIIKEEEFPLYSNSYMLITGKGEETAYTKFSNDRADSFAIRTDILQDAYGHRWVEKVPMQAEAKTHIQNIRRWYELLTERYEGGGLHINACSETENGLRFAYIDGHTLEEVLDDCLDRGDMEGFAACLAKFESYISYRSADSSVVTDYDVVFSNIIIKNNKWYLIDYEWTEEKEIDTRELLHRALYFYIISSEKRKKLKEELIIKNLGFDEETFERIAEKEQYFQQHVTGNRMAMTEMRNAIGQTMLSAEAIEAIYSGKDDRLGNSVQVYMDSGAGFAEETSFFIEDAYKDKHHIVFSLEVDDRTKYVRIDPAMDSCIVTIEEFTWNGRRMLPGKRGCATNGILLGKNSVLFATTDPNIILDVKRMPRQQTNLIQAKLHIVRLPQETAALMASAETRQGFCR